MNGIRKHPLWRAGVRLVAACIGLANTGAIAAPAFDFGYRISGDREVRPVQVFDDGVRTFFQFRPGAVVPLITAAPEGHRVVAVVEGPYHVVDGVPRRFELRAPGRRGRVEPASGIRSVSPGAPAPAATAAGLTGGYAVPLQGDATHPVPAGSMADHVVLFRPGQDNLNPAAADELGRLLARAGSDPSAELIGGDGALSRRRTRAVLQALVRLGVRPTRITIGLPDNHVHDSADAVTVRWRHADTPATWTHPAAPAFTRSSATRAPAASTAGADEPTGRPLPNQFDVLLSDRTVAHTLQRWAARAGHRVAWLSTVHAPVVGEVTVDASTFPEAASRVIAGLRAAGYPLRLDADDDQVLRITSVDAP